MAMVACRHIYMQHLSGSYPTLGFDVIQSIQLIHTALPTYKRIIHVTCRWPFLTLLRRKLGTLRYIASTSRLILSWLLKSSTASLTHWDHDKMAAILADNIFKCIFLNENDRIVISISLKFVPRSPIDNKAALVQVMAWHWTGDKPLSEPMLTQFTDAYMRH